MNICPRCGCRNTALVCSSPVPGAWEVFQCERCDYSWRSTEQPSILPKFRLDEAAIAAMPVNPPIAKAKQ